MDVSEKALPEWERLLAAERHVYRGLVAPWDRWDHVRERGRRFAGVLAGELLGGAEP